ncbi:hypothetical protein ABG768_002912, partial [Culter alburnus]
IHQKSGFPLGFDPVADPDQVERETAESSHQSSLMINLSFSFTPLLSSSELLRGLSICRG